jgi:hypothetical protein
MQGAVFIDSITELFTMSEPTSTIEMVKDWRAEICKEKHITVFASYHLGMRSLDEFVGMLDYVMDGIIEYRFDRSSPSRAFWQGRCASGR